MPIYEYQCAECGHEFEVLILPKTTGTACPKCKSVRLERLVSSFAVDSENTRQANLEAGRRQYAPMKKEKNMEQIKYEQRIMKEESGH